MHTVFLRTGPFELWRLWHGRGRVATRSSAKARLGHGRKRMS
mgnify:CR=1 FL=1